jgi:DNA mismatch endonuclease (patch repair protein)
MTDVHEPEIRSYNMSRIRGRDTKPELIVRKYLHFNGFRYRLHDKSLPGKPDLVLKRWNAVIFVNGCFWHGHEGCKYYVIPKTRTEWWTNKITKTQEKDLQNMERLAQLGWRVLIVWECGLKNNESRNDTLKALSGALKSINPE